MNKYLYFLLWLILIAMISLGVTLNQLSILTPLSITASIIAAVLSLAIGKAKSIKRNKYTKWMFDNSIVGKYKANMIYKTLNQNNEFIKGEKEVFWDINYKKGLLTLSQGSEISKNNHSVLLSEMLIDGKKIYTFQYATVSKNEDMKISPNHKGIHIVEVVDGQITDSYYYNQKPGSGRYTAIKRTT